MTSRGIWVETRVTWRQDTTELLRMKKVESENQAGGGLGPRRPGRDALMAGPPGGGPGRGGGGG